MLYIAQTRQGRNICLFDMAKLKKPAASKTKTGTRAIRLAIIGTGGMAGNHARRFQAIKGVEIVAACDIDLQRAKAFCAQNGIAQAYGDVTALLRESDCEAVSVVTPDSSHAPISIECLRAGRHVLCEKPLALNHAEAKSMVAVARKAGTVAMVNFSYRSWSAIQAVHKLVARGDIGEVRHVEASYLQAWLAGKCWGDWRKSPHLLWRLSKAHGSGGVLGDVGVHILDFATFPVGPIKDVYCRLKAYPKAAGNRIGEFTLDANDSAVINVEFANGALGCIHTSRWVGGHANRLFLKIAGTKGTVEIDSDHTTTGYRICCGRGLDVNKWKSVEVKPTPDNYQRFVTAVRTGKTGEPDFARGAEVQKILDACFRSDQEGKPVRLK